MSDWIRPPGCEGGACVEYRTEGGKVFIRNSEQPEEWMEFTVAEWDAFVAGLQGQQIPVPPLSVQAADREREMLRLQVAELTALGHRLRAQLAGVAPSSLAAENARLRQRADTLEKSLTDSDCEVESLKAERDRYATAVVRAWRERDALERAVAEAVRHRNAAIAEAAVLRHRDRRTQAVVEAARAFVEKLRLSPSGLIGKFNAEFVAAVDLYQKGPIEPPESPLPAEQPPVEALATDGAEAQGEAQGADDWTAKDGVSNSSPEFERIKAEIERLIRGAAFDLIAGRAGTTAGLILANLAHRHGLAPAGSGPGEQIHESSVNLTRSVRAPRVWNAGDPEPEGVEKVRDDDGDLWVRTSQVWIYTDENNTRVPSWWEPLTAGCAPLTEVLPEPAPVENLIAESSLGAALSAIRSQEAVPRFEGDCPECGPGYRYGDEGCRHTPPKPDGEVPEAGRAGEAQEPVLHRYAFQEGWQVIRAFAGEYYQAGVVDALLARRSYSADLDPVAEKNSSDVRPQERTEGLDAAIEAAARALFRGGGSLDLWGQLQPADKVHWRQAAERVLRGASPLIERAALLAAADRMEGRGYTNESAVAWLRLLAEGKTV